MNKSLREAPGGTPLTLVEYGVPWGEVSVLVNGAGAVVAAGMGPVAELAYQLPAAYVGAGWEPGEVPQVADAVEAWVAGDADAITRVPVSLEGTAFAVSVWEELRTVPGGSVVSYAELADMVGRPRAMRAVGTVCGKNRVGIFVPCHRVVQAGGRLGSYGFGGVGVKAELLRLEGVEVRGDDAAARLVERVSAERGRA